jgi:putative transcriptional regulator
MKRLFLAISLTVCLCIAAAIPKVIGAPERHRSAAPLKQGVFIVASPHLNDPNFLHSVVLLVMHGKDGAFGLIINRPTDITLEKVLPDEQQIKGLSLNLFSGGPVNRNLLFFLFHSDKPLAGSQKVFGEVYFTGSLDPIVELIKNRKGIDREIRCYFGYAGWAPGQLEMEVSRGDWIIKEADMETVFSHNPSEIWPSFFKKFQKGIEVRNQSSQPH